MERRTVQIRIAGEQTVRFAAAGDFAASSNTRAVLDHVAAFGPDLARSTCS